MSVSWLVHFESFTSGNVNCRPDARSDFIQIAYFIVYEALLLMTVSTIQSERDAFGLSSRIGQFVLYYSVLSLMYHVLKFAAPANFIEPFDYRFLPWLVGALYKGLCVISPLLATIPLFQRAIDEKDVEPLDGMLATKLGFSYMYAHCSAEFSAENIMCWHAIDQFKRKTTVDAWHIIVDKYIGNSAMLQVNIPAAIQRRVLTMAPTIRTVSVPHRSSSRPPPSPPRSA